MVEAGMDKYMDFRAVHGIYFYNEASKKFVLMPTNKGEIFSSPEFSIIEKRSLFQLLHMCSALFIKMNQVESDLNSTSDFDKDLTIDEEQISKILTVRKQHFSEFLKMYKISDKLLYLLVFIIANYQFNIKDSEGEEHFLSTEDFINRVNKFLRSAGVHSNYPYLYTNYGTSDILQGFSRSSAIYGSLFVVNPKVNFDEITLVKQEPKEGENAENITRFKLRSKMAGDKEFLCSQYLVMSKDYVQHIEGVDTTVEYEKISLLRITILINSLDPEFKIEAPSMFYLFPDNTQRKYAVFAFVTGDKTSSTPEESQYIIYIQMIVETNISNDELEQYQETLKSFFLEKLIGEHPFEIKIHSAYLQRRRKFKFEEELKGTPGFAIVDDDDFLIEFDDYYKKAEDLTKHVIPHNPNMYFFKNFDNETKEDQEKQMEKEEEIEEENHLNNLLESLSKFKVDSSSENDKLGS